MVFSPDIGVEPSAQVLDIPEYACGLVLGLALISTKNPNFEMASIVRPEMALFVLIGVFRGFPAATYRRTPRSKPLCGLDQNKNCSFLNRKLNCHYILLGIGHFLRKMVFALIDH